MASLVIPYKPRKAFVSYHANKKRFAVTVAHRRCGKTVARLNKIIRCAIESKQTNPRFGYICPYWVQAKEIAWQYLKHYTNVLEPMGRKVNESELTITLGHNNATIRLYGAENSERMRGLYFDGIAADETQNMIGATLRTIIMPCLADRQGWLDVSGTPKGWDNLLGEIVTLAREKPEEWFLQILKASDTGIIPASELEILRGMMSKNQYEQEFECSFEAAVEGAVYGEWMQQAHDAGRIKPDIYDPTLPTFTAWDLGYDDATAIWWYQLAKGEVRLVDYYEANQQDINHYCDVLIAKAYNYKGGKHYVPHDAANKLLAAGGRSIVQLAYDKGVVMHVVQATSQQNSIEAARSILPKCWFDAVACKYGIQALKQYQCEFDQRLKVFRSKPKHDFTSHACDAFELIGRVNLNLVTLPPKEAPRFLNQMTVDEVFWPETESQTLHTRI